MSDNPFDVFAADFKAAIPAVEEKNDAAPEPPSIMAQPTPPPVTVMKAPAMEAPPQQPTQQPYGSIYGAPPGAQAMGMQPNGGAAYGAPPPAQYGAPPPAQYGAPPPAQYGPPPVGGMMNGGAQPGALVPVATQPNPYASMVQQQPGPPQQQMMGAPQMPNAGGSFTQQPPPQMMQSDPNAMMQSDPNAMAPPADTGYGQDPWGAAQPNANPPPAPLGTPPVPNGMPQQPGGTPNNSFVGQQQQQTPIQGPPVPTPGPPSQALVPAPNAPNDDPFGIFGGGGPPPDQAGHDAASSMVSVEGPPHPFSQQQVLDAADGGDPWSEMGFGSAPAAPTDNTPAPTVPNANDDERQEGELPPGGEWYDARIFTPTLGVMFFKPQELTDSLFLQTDRSLVDSLDDRPVVAFIVEGSSARAAGVELGHCLLKVNGIDVRNPKEASRLIKEGPRPLPLLFYVPDTQVVVAEGEHMVKYDTRETGAPNSAKDWKPKYCVIGGIIAQPWMMNMYRSKSEYDIAVIETQARRPVSVKVKQFSLQGARIQNDWQGPQMVKYKNKLHPWKYVVVLPVSRNPIKISSPNLGQLKPVHEGIRRVLMAQQRHGGGGGGGSGGGRAPPSPSRDPYGQGGGSSRNDSGGYDQRGGGGGGGGYDQGAPQRDAAGGISSGRRRNQYE